MCEQRHRDEKYWSRIDRPSDSLSSDRVVKTPMGKCDGKVGLLTLKREMNKRMDGGFDFTVYKEGSLQAPKQMYHCGRAVL